MSQEEGDSNAMDSQDDDTAGPSEFDELASDERVQDKTTIPVAHDSKVRGMAFPMPLIGLPSYAPLSPLIGLYMHCLIFF